MPRTPMLLGLAALLTLATVLLLGDTQTPVPPPDPTQPGAWQPGTRLGATAAPAEPSAPLLGGPGDTTAGGPKDAGAADAHPPASEPTGPYRFVVRDHASEAALEGVILADDAGEELGTTDEDGLLEIEDAGVPRLTVRTRKDGYVEQRTRVAAGETREFLLRVGVHVDGRVLRTDTRGPAQFARIIVWDEDLGYLTQVGTDAQGRFRLRAVPAHHPLELIVRTTDLAPHVVHEIFSSSQGDYEIRVGDGGHLRGGVATPEGRPLADVAVVLSAAGTSRLQLRRAGDAESEERDLRLRSLEAHTRTVAQGRYEFHGVPLEQAFVPEAWPAAHHAVRALHSVRFEENGEEQQIDLVVHEPAALRIRIEDETGQRVGGVALTIEMGALPLQPTPAEGHAEGGTLLEGLTPGPVHVLGRLPGAPAQSAAARLESGKTTEVRLAFARGRDLRGMVEDKRGEPIWRAALTWTGAGREEVASARTDAAGRFVLQRLTAPSGALRIAARDLPHTPNAYEGKTLPDVVPAAAPLRITLLDGTRITGRFPDLPAGSILGSAFSGGTPFDDIDLGLGEGGRFARRGPAAGSPARFVFRMSGRPPLLVRERRPFDSEEVRDLGALRFEETNPRLGRVVDEHGLPVHGALVRITAPWSDEKTRTDERGDFALPRMPDEPIPVEVRLQGYPPTPAILHEPSQYTRQTIAIRRSGELTVIVEGAPSKAKTVYVGLHLPGRDTPVRWQGMGLERGRATARFHVPPGRYTVTAMTQHPSSGSAARVDVGAQPESVHLKMRRER